MPHLTPRIELTALALAVALAGTRAGAQASKVLTVPRSDTARPAAQAAKPATGTTPQTKATSSTQPPGVAAPAAPPSIPQGPVLDSIREVVFRNLLERDRAGVGTLAGAFCLGLSAADFKKAGPMPDRADPPEWIVRRVATSRSPARRASTCLFQPNATATRPVPGRALLYSIGNIDLSDDGGRAEVAAGYNYDGYSAGGYTFSVERSDTAWVVKQWRLEWTGKP